MPLSRREFLIGVAGATVLAACSDDDSGAGGDPEPTTTTAARTTTTPPVPALAGPPFTLGVASGDPDTESVVLWTRLAPEPLAGGGMPDEDVPVVWEVATDGDFSSIVASGLATAEPRFAHSLHVVVEGLDAGTDYHYRFRAGEHTSPAGRTRTAPEGSVASMRFAFASCQHWEAGYWPAHEHLADEELDLVVWLGDYIYEGAAEPGGVRLHEGPEPMTLDAYRNRYAQYKGDTALQGAHAAFPWLVVWDDHEVENNYAGDSPDDGGPPDAFRSRRAAAYQAWWEHMPVRLDPPDGARLEINRALEWGGLASIFAIDTRQHRADQPCDRGGDLGASCPEREEPGRSMLGEEQEAWLGDALRASEATWNVLANQVIFAPAPIPVGATTVYNLDQWDGYPSARDRVLGFVADTENVVIVTGDIHASAVAEIRRDEEVVAVEFVGTSISSSFPVELIEIFEVGARSAGAKMADARHRGYVRCTLTSDSFTAEYRTVESVATATSPVATASTWVVDAGTPGVRAA